MVKIYKSLENGICEIEEILSGSWINMINPNKEEVTKISNKLNVPIEFITAALDANEKPRVEIEDDVKLIIVDIPTIDTDMPEYEAYSTFPMSIIVVNDIIITVCTHNTSILNEIFSGKVKDIKTNFKNRFVFRILIRVAQRFLLYLSKIEQTSNKIEKQLNETLKNKELLQLLALSKSLIYFKASLKSNEAILRKIMRGRILKLYEEDKELLEDASIEVAQAIDMASSYAEILKATMETYSSVVSNNLNIIMKVLAIITIVMTVPEIIFGFYGMNVSSLPLSQYSWFPIVISLVGGLLIWGILKTVKFHK